MGEFLHKPHRFRKTPPERSYLSAVPDHNYYAALIALTPVVLLAEWLISAALIHVLLRVFQKESDMDQILNITGFVALSIGVILLVWDWIWTLLGGMNQYLLGTSHLIIDIWGVIVAAISLRMILKTPLWLGTLANVLGIAISLPIAVMFMRSPV